MNLKKPKVTRNFRFDPDRLAEYENLSGGNLSDKVRELLERWRASEKRKQKKNV